jgi:inosine/xanthosine triphosphatase
MKVNVGSQNQTKLDAVKDAIKLYPNVFSDSEVSGIDVKLEEFGHPKSLEEIVTGAIERAEGAFIDCDYSFGIESGLFEVPHSLSGYMEIQACAIYDGKNIHLGFSPAFEWPKKVTELILKNEADGSAALRLAGITEHDKVGAMSGGAMGMLTNGRLTREDQIKSSIISAMIQIEKRELYI